MFLNSSFKFNRFGQEIDNIETVISEFDHKIEEIKTGFSANAKTAFERVKDELLSRAEKQVSFKKGYVSVKNKRIVSVSKAKDPNDAVTKEQLDEVNSKVDGLLKGIEVTDDCVKIKNHRRICDISSGKNNDDVVNYIQLVDTFKPLVDELIELKREISELERRLPIN